MRLRAVRQNCDSNFNRLARQRRLPAVAARLFFYLTRICSGGKVRLWAVRQNCDSNFSRLARQRKLPAVAARLFFLFNGNSVVVGR